MESLKTLTDWAAAAAALATILSLFALLVRGIRAIIALPRQIRAYFFRPKYILIPTPEELAKYCEKSFDGRRPTLDEIHEEKLAGIAKRRSDAQNQTSARVVLLAASFCVAYLTFLWRLIYLAALPNRDLPRPGLVATLGVAILLWLAWIIAMLARDMKIVSAKRNTSR